MSNDNLIYFAALATNHSKAAVHMLLEYLLYKLQTENHNDLSNEIIFDIVWISSKNYFKETRP